MSEIIVLDNEYITLRYLPDKKMLYHTVHKPISGQPQRDALSVGFDALQKYGISKWLSDDRNNGPVSEEDMAWATANLRRPIEAGWKYWALVVPQMVVAAGAMIPTIQTLYNFGLRMEVFSKLEEAFEWLDHLEN
jgi:hypothetical protein